MSSERKDEVLDDTKAVSDEASSENVGMADELRERIQGSLDEPDKPSSERELPPLINDDAVSDKPEKKPGLLVRLFKAAVKTTVALVFVGGAFVGYLIYEENQSTDGDEPKPIAELIEQSEKEPPELGMPEHKPLQLAELTNTGEKIREEIANGATAEFEGEIVLEGVEQKTVTIGGYEVKVPEFLLDNFIADLDGVKKRVEGYTGQISEIYSKIDDLTKSLENKFIEDQKQEQEIAALKAQIAALTKDVDKLERNDRRQAAVRAAAVKKAEIPRVKGFFVWQYKAGVEIDYKGSTDRYYEGDMLGDMRVVKVDLIKEKVVVRKDGKEVML